jgi:hypothetical protein
MDSLMMWSVAKRWLMVIVSFCMCGRSLAVSNQTDHTLDNGCRRQMSAVDRWVLRGRQCCV